MLELSAYGISIRCSVKDLEKLGNLSEKNFTEVITFLKKSSTELGVDVKGSIKAMFSSQKISGVDEIKGVLESLMGTADKE